MSAREEFIELFTTHIHREGSEALLDYLQNKSDFFTSPASAKFHGAYVGGLCDHSVNVYHCLREYLERERVKELYGLEYGEESIAIAALLHDVCKIGCYKTGTRNVKGPDGKWQAVPTFFYGEVGLYSQRLHASHPGGGHGHPLAHGIFGRRGRPAGGAGPPAVSPGLCPERGRYGGHVFPGK